MILPAAADPTDIMKFDIVPSCPIDTRLIQYKNSVFKFKLSYKEVLEKHKEVDLGPHVNSEIEEVVQAMILILEHDGELVRIQTEHFIVEPSLKFWKVGKNFEFRQNDEILKAHQNVIILTFLPIFQEQRLLPAEVQRIEANSSSGHRTRSASKNPSKNVNGTSTESGPKNSDSRSKPKKVKSLNSPAASPSKNSPSQIVAADNNFKAGSPSPSRLKSHIRSLNSSPNKNGPNIVSADVRVGSPGRSKSQRKTFLSSSAGTGGEGCGQASPVTGVVTKSKAEEDTSSQLSSKSNLRSSKSKDSESKFQRRDSSKNMQKDVNKRSIGGSWSLRKQSSRRANIRYSVRRKAHSFLATAPTNLLAQRSSRFHKQKQDKKVESSGSKKTVNMVSKTVTSTEKCKRERGLPTKAPTKTRSATEMSRIQSVDNKFHQQPQRNQQILKPVSRSRDSQQTSMENFSLRRSPRKVSPQKKNESVNTVSRTIVTRNVTADEESLRNFTLDQSVDSVRPKRSSSRVFEQKDRHVVEKGEREEELKLQAMAGFCLDDGGDGQTLRGTKRTRSLAQFFSDTVVAPIKKAFRNTKSL